MRTEREVFFGMFEGRTKVWNLNLCSWASWAAKRRRVEARENEWLYWRLMTEEEKEEEAKRKVCEKRLEK
jgi:hypothetical protein